MGYDKELTEQLLGDIGPLRFNPYVIKVCAQCLKQEKLRYRGGRKQGTTHLCRTCANGRPETRAATSATIKKLWERPDYRAAITDSSKQCSNTPEARERSRQAALTQWASPAFRVLVEGNSSTIWDDPDRRKRMSAFRDSNNFKERMIQINRTKSYDGLKLTQEEFLERAIARWSDQYGYTNAVYVDWASAISVTCHEHGDFLIAAGSHLGGIGCPSCSISSGQHDLLSFIRSITGQLILINDRKAIKPFELDIYIPEIGLAFEYNGSYYHSFGSSESPYQRNYHLMKTRLAEAAGIRLIHISEYDWLHKNALIRSMVAHKLGKSTRVWARSLEVRAVTTPEYRYFLVVSHLKGYKSAIVRYGLYRGDELLSVMSFDQSNAGWKIERFATKTGMTVVGGASKLFAAFRRQYNPDSVMTFADRGISDSGVYVRLGFTKIGTTKPGYVYLDGKGLRPLSRISCQKHKLATLLGDRFDPNVSESGNMFQAGYRRLWDSGNHKLIWLRPN